MKKMDNNTLEQTQKELNDFLSKASIHTYKHDELKAGGSKIFNCQRGQKMIEISVKAFDAIIGHYVKNGKKIDENDKGNILVQVFVILEKEGFINFNLE